MEMIQKTTERLFDYCCQNKWSGDDPYDALNSRIVNEMPNLQNRIGRLILTQFMKRSPVNFRRIMLVPKEENPKGLAVFITALLILRDINFLKDDDEIFNLLKRLIELKSPAINHYCWGYNFDWQSRDGFLPKYTPNIICTTFSGNALIEAYLKYSNNKYLEMAMSAGDYLLQGLNITKFSDGISFSYTPLESGQVHNANLLGAAFLSRLYSITRAQRYYEPALNAVRYSANRQNTDGSWFYGEDKTQKWIDNFHTGYNLCALKNISKYLSINDYDLNIKIGFKYYRENFFRKDGAPKYFHNKTYPIDIHSIAQSIITLIEFKNYDPANLDLAFNIYRWAMENMWDKQGYYYYYQITPYYKNKISYMRWSQSWMLLALANLLKNIH